MKATAKNTAKGLVVSKKSPIFALPRIPYGNIQSHTKPFWAYSCCTSGNPVSGFLAELTGYALFVSSPLCVQPCQEPTQSIWRSIVTRLHLVMSIASSLIERYCDSISKTPTSFGLKFLANEKFAKSKTLCTFVMRHLSITEYILYSRAYGRIFVTHLRSAMWGCRNLSKVRPSFVHITHRLCYRLCDTLTRLANCRRSTVTGLPQTTSIESSPTGRYSVPILTIPTSFGELANEKFAKSKTLCTFVMRLNHFVRYILSSNAHGRISLAHLCPHSCGSVASSEVRPLFVHIAHQLCPKLCDRTTRLANCRRSIVTRLHLVMSIASSRIGRYCDSISKNPTSFGLKFLANEKFAKSKTLCTFVMRLNHFVRYILSSNAHGRISLAHLCPHSCGSVASSEVRPLFVHIAHQLCPKLCDKPTRLANCRRSTVTGLPQTTSIESSPTGRYSVPILTHPTSFGWKFTVIRRRLYIAMLRLSRPARRYWRLVQQSSSSSGAVLPSASTISLSAAASSPNLKSFAL